MNVGPMLRHKRSEYPPASIVGVPAFVICAWCRVLRMFPRRNIVVSHVGGCFTIRGTTCAKASAGIPRIRVVLAAEFVSTHDATLAGHDELAAVVDPHGVCRHADRVGRAARGRDLNEHFEHDVRRLVCFPSRVGLVR